MKTTTVIVATLASAGSVQAHVAAWVKGMYCLVSHVCLFVLASS